MGWEDDRAVSEVLGAILLFGIIVLAIGGYQSFVVPQQNAEIEFNHNERASGDMQDLRNAIVQAAGDNEARSSSVELRPQYPTRTFTLNPSPPGGSIRTAAHGEIRIEDAAFTSREVCDRTYSQGDVETVPTRSLTFTPNYMAYQNGQTVTIDSSMVYRGAGEDALVDTSQVLIQGSQIHFTPLEGDLSKSGVRTQSVTVIPSNSGGISVGDDAEDDFNVTIPTELSASTWEAEIESAHVVDVHDVDGENAVKIQMRGTDNGGPTSYTVRCTPIGIDQSPELNPPSLPIAGDGEDIQDGLNPYGAFVLEDAEIDENNDAEVTFKHRGNKLWDENVSLEITEARFVYFGPVGQGRGPDGNPFKPPHNAHYNNQEFEIGGEAEEVAGDSWNPGDSDSITISFERNGNDYDVTDGDFFILRLRVEGEGVDPIVAEYFVGPRDQPSG